MAGQGDDRPSSEGMAAEASGISLDACRACGYTIRGLSSESACPECGTAVAPSRGSLTLGSADPAWLKRLVRGLGVGGAFDLIVPIFLLQIARRDAKAPFDADWFWWILMIGIAVTVVRAVRAMMGITARDPRETENESTWSPRLVARAAYAASLGAQFISVFASYVPAGSLVAAGNSPVTRKLSFVFLTIAVVACARRLRWLAQRIPDQNAVSLLRRAEGTVTWSWSLTIILLAIADLIPLPPMATLGLRLVGLLSFIAVLVSLARLNIASHAFVCAMGPIRDLPSLRKVQT